MNIYNKSIEQIKQGNNLDKHRMEGRGKTVNSMVQSHDVPGAKSDV